jgi:hypothetical protein
MVDRVGSPSTPTTTQQPAAPSSPSSTDKVNQAVADIRDKLKDGGWREDDVTHDELKEIAAIFDGLNASEARQVMAQLSQGDLNKIADEMKSGGIGNFDGLSADQRHDFIADLAGKLDSAQFEKLAKAFDQPQELADIVAASGNNDAKIGFINAYKADASSSAQPGGFLDSLSGVTQYGNESARAIGTVLGSMDARGIERALGTTDPSTGELTGGALSPTQLRTVMDACLGQTSYSGGVMGGGGPPSYGFQADRLNKILDAAARSGDAGLKAEVFQAAAQSLEKVQGVGGILTPAVNAGEQASAISEHMAGLLGTDTRGIVGRLEDVDATGNALKTFSRQMLADGKTEPLHDMLVELRNGPAGNASQYLKDPQHAQDLGYGIGAVAAGLKSLEKSRQEEAQLLGSLIESVVGNLPYGGDAITNASQALLDRTVGEVADASKSAPRAFYELMVNGLDATTQTHLDAAMSRVINLQDL